MIIDVNHAISRLIYNFDCVIVPNFGAIISNYIPAKYNKELNTFNPPSKCLSFNRNITLNDGLLTNYISTCYNLSYNESQNEVSKFVDFINFNLENQGIITLSQIGTFHKKNELISFTPDNSVNMLIDAFGLPVLQLPLTENEISRIEYNLKSNNGIVKKLVLGVPLLLLLAIVPLKMSFKTQNNFTKASFANFHSQPNYSNQSLSSIIDSNTTIKNALYFNKSKSDSIAVSNINKSNEPIESTSNEIKVEENINGYFIIAASFVEMERVNNFYSELKSKNINANLLKSQNKLRISVGYFDNINDANIASENFKLKHPEYPTWILKN